MFPTTPTGKARLAIGMAILAATAIVLLVVGLDLTSAIVQLALFAFGVVSWIAVGKGDRDVSSRSASHLRARRLHAESGSVTVTHEGDGSVSVRDVTAAKDIGIEHRSQR